MSSLNSPTCDLEDTECELYLKICKAHQDDVVGFLKDARVNSFKTDVYLQAFDDSGSTKANFPAHKEVLAAASPFLAELLESTDDCDVHISFSEFKNNQLKLLLDYIYTGEICASKDLMQEFELCLKELGILGTHSYTSLDGKPEKHASCVSQPLTSVEISSNNDSSLIQETFLNPLENDHQLLEQSRLISEPSDSENVHSEEEEEEENEEGDVISSSNKLFKSGKRSCSICNQVFVNTNELKAHLKESHSRSSERPYVCPVCQKAFRHLNVLRTHSRVHTGEKPFSCSTCKRAFSHKSTLNEHMNLHSDDRPYGCDKCQRRFKQRKSLRAHRCESVQEEVFQCEVCGRHFINRKALALHRIHHETGKNKTPQEKSFLCDICARGFSNKYLLKAHQMTHVSSEDKRFECNVCHKKFALKKTLQVHETSHKTESKGPYQCSFCSKSFRYVANLDAHERIHTGQKPFDCNLCGVAFRQKSSLKEHMVTHELKPEERPFMCEICNRTFQSRRQFVAHRYSHNKQTKRCPVCKKRFYNADRLASHISEHDNIDDLEPDEIGNTVTAHMNEDGELIITQDVDEIGEGALIFTPSLLHVIQSSEETADQIVNTEGQDEGRQWSLEVVIDPQT